jgi:alpha-tubulin suppressor-like RCC1 family protein
MMCRAIVGFMIRCVQKLQLGLGDRTQRNMPCVVPGMKEKGECVFGACGKFHTVVVMANGDSYAWGFNGMGQTGTGEVRLWIRAFPHLCSQWFMTEKHCMHINA